MCIRDRYQRRVRGTSTRAMSGVKTRRREVRARIFTDKVPACFKAALPLFKTLDHAQLIQEAAEKHAANLEDENTSIELGERHEVDAAVRCLVQQVARLGDRMPLENAKKNLVDEFKVHPEIANLLCQVIPPRRAGIVALQEKKAPALRQLKELRWRVDVHISTSSLRKKMKPTILMQLMFEDGAIKTLECSPEMFQDLRYSVTKLLHEVQRIEVRLKNDGKKKKACLLYTSDAADEEDSVDLGGRRIIKKKKKQRSKT
eukprot:TRINITY_DN20279_c0_g1_i1.p1 TRINITY_DN20279_c0_g1~~TRINITY_DN20279_c0_g1_i1.p1  ORF type:complete len:259 (+),score=72.00 TRINITY_DN20279_c0_g1_i1:83-859(+)